MNKHCYLFALEVIPMSVGDIYEELPLHCTLMHRFWSELEPEVLANKVYDFLKEVKPITLKPYERLLLGPKQVPVSELELTDEFKHLHMGLYELLNDLGVVYTAPEWVGERYRAHVTERENARLEVGSEQDSNAVYLIEVEVPKYDHKRLIRAKFDLHC
jgi:hypothetical protein